MTQPEHDVRTTLHGRRFNVLTSYQRPYDVILTSCAGWGINNTSKKIIILFVSSSLVNFMFELNPLIEQRVCDPKSLF